MGHASYTRGSQLIAERIARDLREQITPADHQVRLWNNFVEMHGHYF